MRVDSQSSSFQSIILELVRDRLNLMITEVFQLTRKVNFSDHNKLTKIVLKEIACGRINSVHISAKQAKNFIRFIDRTSCHQEMGNGSDSYPKTKDVYTEGDNPFVKSPFK